MAKHYVSMKYHPCTGCQHIRFGMTDHDTGYTEPDSCAVTEKLFEDGEASEGVSILLEKVLMELADMRRCPARKNKP